MPGRKFYGQLSNRRTFAGLLPKKILPGKCRAEILPGSLKAGMARTFQNTSYGYNSSCTYKYNSSCTHEEFFDFDQTKSSHLICIKWLCKNAKRIHLFVKREKTKDKRQTRTEEKEKETVSDHFTKDMWRSARQGFETSWLHKRAAQSASPRLVPWAKMATVKTRMCTLVHTPWRTRAPFVFKRKAL